MDFTNVVKSVFSYLRRRWTECGVSHIPRVKNSFLPFSNMFGRYKYFKACRISRFQQIYNSPISYLCKREHSRLFAITLRPSSFSSRIVYVYRLCVSAATDNKMHTQVRSKGRYTKGLSILSTPACDARMVFHRNNVDDIMAAGSETMCSVLDLSFRALLKFEAFWTAFWTFLEN